VGANALAGGVDPRPGKQSLRHKKIRIHDMDPDDVLRG
jgi:hypothetical protein